MNFLDLALVYKRTVIMLSLLIVISGVLTYQSISKESSPDVSIPTIYVSAPYQGVSSDDADKLLVKPLVTKLESVEGLKELKSIAGEGYSAITLEFESGVDMDQALLDVREEVRKAKPDLPADADEPKVIEINVALFPIITIGLSGNVDESQLVEIAEDLQDELTTIPGVLEVELTGKREEIVEVVIHPEKLQSYNLSISDVSRFLQSNNQTVTSGSLISGSGRFSMQIEGLVDNLDTLMRMPILAQDDRVINLSDVAIVRRSYNFAESITRVQGQPSLELRVKKRIGVNIIETVNAVKTALDDASKQWPEQVSAFTYQDESIYIRNNLSDLFNNVILATLLVMLVVILTLGSANALLVGLAIPVTFLAAILALGLLGLTMNMVVLFALIMSVGMIVDGSIVVTEYADRRMLEGASRIQAYADAGKLMAAPIFASTITTLAVFAPLLFWPDVIGEFMQYIPITVILTLSASFVITILLVPVLGSIFGRPGGNARRTIEVQQFSSGSADITLLGGITGWYVRLMDVLISRPLLTLIGMFVLCGGIVFAYGKFGNGVEFFPKNEPEQGILEVRARGNLSIEEKNRLAWKAEQIVLSYDEVRVVSTTVIVDPPSESSSRDVIATINMEFEDWSVRRTADELISEMLAQMSGIPGIVVESQVQQFGPPSPADLVLELRGDDPIMLDQEVDRVRQLLFDDGAFTEITDSRPIEGIDIEIQIDRDQAARYGANLSEIGNMVKLITNGVKIGDYIPVDLDEKIDILLRYPQSTRTFDAVEDMRIRTQRGLVPLALFIQRKEVPRRGEVNRIEGKQFFTVQADVKNTFSKPVSIAKMTQMLQQLELDQSVQLLFRGEQEDQAKAGAFLMKAFGAAFFIMLIILVTQFNSIYQATLILSAIVFSVFGVLIGLMVRGEAFGIVMSGVGVIALSGIVVNNNIILITTYNLLRKSGLVARQAILSVCAQRLRPVILTSFTTCIGLLPMVLQVNIDIANRSLIYGSPASQIWVQLSTAIAGGLAFATIVTLVITPCLLYLPAKRKERKHALHTQESSIKKPLVLSG